MRHVHLGGKFALRKLYKVRKFTTILLFLLAVGAMQAQQKIVLEGHFQGKSLYVQNPYATSGVGFATTQVRINGDVLPSEINSSAYEIDFSHFMMKKGDEVVVTIEHKDGSVPKVLNPEVLKPRSTFELVAQDLSKDGKYTWKTKGETAKLPYIVQQFRWNKWVKVGEVDGVGTPDEHEYAFNVTLHSGSNKVRVIQPDFDGKRKVSRAASQTASVTSSIECSISQKDKTAIVLSSESLYEVYDIYGNLVKKGFSSEISTANLAKGVYYLNYDNKMDQFVKK